MNDQVAELMNSFQNPGFYRYQPFERVQPGEEGVSDNSSQSEYSQEGDDASSPRRDTSPLPSTSTGVTIQSDEKKNLKRNRARGKAEGETSSNKN